MLFSRPAQLDFRSRRETYAADPSLQDHSVESVKS